MLDSLLDRFSTPTLIIVREICTAISLFSISLLAYVVIAEMIIKYAGLR